VQRTVRSLQINQLRKEPGFARVNAQANIHLAYKTPLRKRCRSQATTPNNRPTPAVSAIANAPQKVTLTAPMVTAAPPVRAARPPRNAKNTSDEIATTGIKRGPGKAHATNNGNMAPAMNVPAEENAA
jgi:hypothetical protein